MRELFLSAQSRERCAQLNPAQSNSKRLTNYVTGAILKQNFCYSQYRKKKKKKVEGIINVHPIYAEFRYIGVQLGELMKIFKSVGGWSEKR